MTTLTKPGSGRRSQQRHTAALRDFRDHGDHGRPGKWKEYRGVHLADVRADYAWDGQDYSLKDYSVVRDENEIGDTMSKSDPSPKLDSDLRNWACQDACNQARATIEQIEARIIILMAVEVDNDHREAHEEQLAGLQRLLAAARTAAIKVLIKYGVIQVADGQFVIEYDTGYCSTGTVDDLAELGIVEGDPRRRTPNYDGYAAVETDGLAGVSVTTNPDRPLYQKVWVPA